MNALSTITVFPVTKTEINNYVKYALSEVDEGMYNPLEIDIHLKAVEETVKQLRKGIKAEVLNEADKYDKQELLGAKVSKSQRAKYDFSECNDSELNDINIKISQLTARKEAKEKYLKTLKEQTPDAETGELLNPPTVKYTEVLSLTLAK